MNQKYKEIYENSIKNREKFWQEISNSIFWYKKPTKILNSDNPPFYKWFEDGVTNTCYNTLPYLDKINNIHAIERTLYSEYLGLAGRVDCIAEYEGELAVIDFKTSTKIKPENWCTNYFVQEMFYAAAYYELTEIPVTKLITIMVTPDGEVKVFDKRNKGDYIKLLVRYIKEFVSHNTRSPNGQ